jgi:hypothetical protein
MVLPFVRAFLLLFLLHGSGWSHEHTLPSTCTCKAPVRPLFQAMHVLLLTLSAQCRLVHNAVYLLGNYVYKFQTIASYGKVAGEQ